MLAEECHRKGNTEHGGSKAFGNTDGDNGENHGMQHWNNIRNANK